MHRMLIAFTHLYVFFISVYSVSSQLYENFENLTFTFDCTNKAVGFYADKEYDCQIFHMCNEQGKRIPHVCANETSFNQEFRICDWEYNFDCSEAEKWQVKVKFFCAT
ncbi:hypothetical protein FQA39_LY09545 [Lamprigera yunnana]|nr:hypothetical protein FQA39_LY09545 [Lamprigera yunnana]